MWFNLRVQPPLLRWSRNLIKLGYLKGRKRRDARAIEEALARLHSDLCRDQTLRNGDPPLIACGQLRLRRFRREVADVKHRPTARCRPNARAAKAKPPGGGSLGGSCLEPRQLGRIGVGGLGIHPSKDGDLKDRNRLAAVKVVLVPLTGRPVLPPKFFKPPRKPRPGPFQSCSHDKPPPSTSWDILQGMAARSDLRQTS